MSITDDDQPVPEPAVPEPAVPEPAVPEPAAPEPAAPKPTGEDRAGSTAGDQGGEEGGGGGGRYGPGGESEPGPGGRPGGRLPRASVAGAVIGLLLGLLGFALVVQLRSNATDPGLATARPEDLVRILSDLDARQERLRQEISQLEDSQRQLASGAQGREAALRQARRQADELGVLAGTLPAQGPGLEVRFMPGGDGIPAVTVLDTVEELRGAGGEALQIAGQDSAPVRIVASTY